MCFALLILQVQHPSTCDVVEAGCHQLEARLSVTISASSPYCITLLQSMLLHHLAPVHTAGNFVRSTDPCPQQQTAVLELLAPNVHKSA